MNIREVQTRLAALGHDPGGIDGVLGRKTRAAVEAFQQARGLTVDGIVGPQTMRALAQGAAVMPANSLLPILPWLEEARRHIGLREIAGPKHHPTIVSWLERLKAPWRDDETAWCGTFVGWCLAQALPDEPLPANPFGARQWQKFGVPLVKPMNGAIGVFWRGSPSGWQGHVGFLVGQDEAAFHVLGGNQANAVSIARMAKNRFLEARWPSSFVKPAERLANRALGTSLSVNEA